MKEVFLAIESYINKVGYPPTVRELCQMTNKTSTATINYHLKKLKENGYINYIDNKARTIVILKSFIINV